MAKVTLPSGEKVEGVIKDGKTYLASGERVPVGALVDTGAGGVWKMTNTGGVKATQDEITGGTIVPQQKTTTPTITQTTPTTTSTYQEDINQLKKLQQQLTAQQLQQAQQESISALEQEKAQVPQLYKQQRNIAVGQSEQYARNFAEYLANRGLTTSGAAAQGEISRQGNLSTALSTLGQQQAQAITNINRQISGVNTSTASQLANANLQLEQDYLSKIATQNQSEREQAFQNQVAGIGQYSQDYMAEIQRRQAINPNDPLIPYLYQARQEKISSQQESESAYVKSLEDNAWKIFTNTGVANQYVQDILGIPKGTTTVSYMNATKSSGTTTDNKVSLSNHEKIIKANYVKEDIATGEKDIDKLAINNYVQEELSTGRITQKDANILKKEYGIPETIQAIGEYKNLLDTVYTDDESKLSIIEKAVELGAMTEEDAKYLLKEYGLLEEE